MGTKLVYKEGYAAPLSLSDGVLVDVGRSAMYRIHGLTNDRIYTVRAFAYNPHGQVQTDIDGAVASFMPVTGVPFGGMSAGSLVTVGVGGTPREFIVVQQGKPSALYDSSFDGGTILLMKDLYESRQWHGSDVNDYANSTIHSYLNGAFFDLIDADIRAEIRQVKIPYRLGSGTSKTVNSGASGLDAKVWLLSGYEVNWTTATNQYFVVDGVTLSYFAGTAAIDTKRMSSTIP